MPVKHRDLRDAETIFSQRNCPGDFVVHLRDRELVAHLGEKAAMSFGDALLVLDPGEAELVAPPAVPQSDR
jgi:hypothetical protein